MSNAGYLIFQEKEINAYCAQNALNPDDMIHAAVCLTYLRLNHSYFDIFPEDAHISVAEFIKLSREAPYSCELPISYVKTEPGRLQLSFQEEVSEEIRKAFSGCLGHLLQEMCTKKTIYETHLLPEEAEAAVLKASTGSCSRPSGLTWIDRFEEHAGTRPGHPAAVDCSVQITYGELNRSANKIARYILEQGIRENEFVIVQTKRTVAFLIGVLGVGKAGAAYVPLDAEYTEKTRNYILSNSGASLILTDEKIAKILASYADFDENINLSRLEKAAYMIYTSGTTGNPKGVVIPHKAINALAAWIIPMFGLDTTKRNLLFSSVSFDASTLDYIYPIISGGTVYIADEGTRMSIKALADYINENKITGFSGCYSVEREVLLRYDFHLDYVLAGGEPFVTFRKLNHRVFNGYGPTEFTAISSMHAVDTANESLPSIGGPAPGSIQQVLDCFLKPLPPGIAGELCLSGDQIALGYCHNEEATRKGFITLENGLKAYRTGDLVRLNQDLEFDYLGRIDQQVKLRGYRIEPAQIESKVLKIMQVTACVAVVRKVNSIRKLCLFYVAEEELSAGEFKKQLGGELPDYMIPEFYQRINAIPVTRNGKVDYRAIPDILETGRTAYTAPETPLEKQFCLSIEKVLKCGKVGLSDNFTELGGDSLKAMELVQELDLPGFDITDIYRSRNVREIVRNFEAKSGISGKAAGTKTRYGLLGAQHNFYNIYRRNSGYTSCNLHGLYHMKPEINKDLLLHSLNRLVKCHPVFKTRFVLSGCGVSQRIESSKFIVPVTAECCSKEELFAKLDTLVVPYDIFREPMYRLRLFDTGHDGLYLFMDFNHLIFDGYSYDVFWENLSDIYKGNPVKRDEYLKVLAEIEKHDATAPAQVFPDTKKTACILPYDFKEPRVQGFENYKDAYSVRSALSDAALIRACRRFSVTPNAFFMTCFLLTLCKMTKNPDVCTSWIHNGRFSNLFLNSIGLMISLHLVTLTMDPQQRLSDVFTSIQDQITESLDPAAPNAYMGHDLQEDPICCFQYNDNTKSKINDLVNARIELPNPHFNPAFYFEMEVNKREDGLYINCVSNKYHYEIGTIINFAARMDEIILKTAGDKNPEYVKDILRS